MLEPESCYRALSARDPRFDGLFFVGVATTGIYCRPVCTARLPAQSNCRFLRSAAAAEEAGFRPCLRCRPERAPGRAIVDATHRLARNALTRIQAGALNGGTVADLAAALHTSPRQLRRALRREYGASPVQLAQTQRLLLAKQLLTDSDLPVGRVALASGFGSLRRFNHLFRERYRLSPSGLRRGERSCATSGSGALHLRLEFRPPFHWKTILAFLSSRAVPGVEMVRAGSYHRTVSLNGRRGWVTVEGPTMKGRALRVRVSENLLPVLMPLLARLRRLFDLDAEPARISEDLATDPRLHPLVARRPGLRVPGALDPFEAALRAVLGQQISVVAATTVAGRIADRFGDRAEGGLPELERHTPTAEALSVASPEELKGLGMPLSRARCIVHLASAVSQESISLDLASPPQETVNRLLEIPGIGPWTAEYIALRALHWPDAFPAGDLGLRKALGGAGEADVRKMAEAWRPWRGYAAIHLWESLHAPEHTNRQEDER